MTAALAIAMRYWRVALIALLLAALGVQTMRINNAQKQAAELRAQVVEVTLQAEKRERDKEAQWIADNRKVADDARLKIKSAVADASAARNASVRLQQRIAAYVASDAGANSGPTAGGPPASAPVLAELLQRMGSAAGKYAEAADQSRVAGQACQAAYDALTK